MSDKQILYIEDNLHNRRIVRKILTTRGFGIQEAEDGLIGYGVIKDHKPPLVLLDISLPSMDGIEIAKLVKADPRTRHVVLIAITASAMHGDRERFLEAGCDDYLSKPFNAQDLVEIVEKHYNQISQKFKDLTSPLFMRGLTPAISHIPKEPAPSRRKAQAVQKSEKPAKKAEKVEKDEGVKPSVINKVEEKDSPKKENKAPVKPAEAKEEIKSDKSAMDKSVEVKEEIKTEITAVVDSESDTSSNTIEKPTAEIKSAQDNSETDNGSVQNADSNNKSSKDDSEVKAVSQSSTNGNSEKKPAAKKAKSEEKPRENTVENPTPANESSKPKRISAEKKIETILVGAINTDNIQPPDPNFNDGPIVTDPVEKIVEGALLEEDKMLDFDLDFISEPENNTIPETKSDPVAETMPEPVTEAAAGAISKPPVAEGSPLPPVKEEKIPEPKPVNPDNVNIDELYDEEKINILVVDDSHVDSRLIRRMFDGEDSIDVREANSAKEALLSMRKYTPDIILLDLYMPNINGEEFITKLMENEFTRNLPVLIISGKEIDTGTLTRLNEKSLGVITKTDLNKNKIMPYLNEIKLRQSL